MLKGKKISHKKSFHSKNEENQKGNRKYPKWLYILIFILLVMLIIVRLFHKKPF
jgi:hypothetical protein